MSAPLSKAEAAEMLATEQDPDRWLRDAIGRRIETLASNATASVELRAIAELAALHAAWVERPVPDLAGAPVGTRAVIEGEPDVGIRTVEVVRVSSNSDPSLPAWAEVDGPTSARWSLNMIATSDIEITYVPRKVTR